jgi:GDSL-like Lipase/Acylhydrolase family
MATRGRARRPATKRRAKTAAPAAGPVTLEEAKALARTKKPKLAVKAARATLAPPTPAAVGEERERLREEQRSERARRIRDYKATMEIMKRRGARPPRPKGGAKPKGGKVKAKPAVAFAPLQIFAEGDSWFDYPPFIFNGGIIPRLESRLGVPILNLAKAGDEVRYMLGVEERAILTEQFTNGCPAGGPWDVLLFSGGGNDIVDNPMALWVKDFDATVPPASLINQPRFGAALTLVRAGYEDLITLRDNLSPNTHLIFQSYDFAIPDGRGICHLGPWLKPTFDLRNFPTRAAGQAVVKAMLEQFAAVLTALAQRPGVTFINGQGTLTPQPASWHNELHPKQAGFDAFADLFHAKLKELFPSRVA